LTGEAPIRENFAAAMLQEIFQGITSDVTLVDPMCGSATMLTEAMNYHIPLHLRPFAFETAPFFKGKMIRLPLITTKLPVKNIMGFDINEVIEEFLNETPNLIL
jgi:23S rRNA G2445 N2-methylase RlmL